MTAGGGAALSGLWSFPGCATGFSGKRDPMDKPRRPRTRKSAISPFGGKLDNLGSMALVEKRERGRGVRSKGGRG